MISATRSSNRLSVVTQDDTRIAADKAVRREGNVTEFERGRFTPCKNDAGMPPLWCLSAARIVHDQQAATITYQDAQFELFGVPVLYLPYFQHPDPSVKRQSGFLMPSHSNSSTLGYSVEVPYYFALAPNADFTFHPRYYSDHGVLWQGEWRHRLANGQYNVKLAGIDDELARRPSTTSDGADRSRPRASSRSRPGGATAGTSPSRATKPSGASTASIRSCRRTASTSPTCRA